MDTSDSCPQALGDPSPAGQQTHLVHPWALAIRHAHPSLGPQAGLVSRRSHSSLCQLGPQAAVPAKAAAGLVQGGARSWAPCPFGKELDGERAELSPSPWHALLTLSLPRGRPSQPSGADLPSPAPRPLGLHNGWGMGPFLQAQSPAERRWGPSFLSQIRLSLGPRFRKWQRGKAAICPHLDRWEVSGLVTEMSSDLLPLSKAGGRRVSVDTARRAWAGCAVPSPLSPRPHPLSHNFS